MSSQLPAEQATSTRRTFFSGAATVGTAAAVAAALPPLGADSANQPSLPPAPDNGGGYSLSEHVKRYYQTACV